MIPRYAASPLGMVAANALLVGLVLSAMETAGWIRWGHEGLLLAIVPILGWVVSDWWIERKSSP